MTAYDFEKQKQLLALAEQDYPYTVWETCRKEFEPAFMPSRIPSRRK